jgi:hypothetical protein
MQKFRLSFCLACFLWLGVATVGKGQVISTTAGLATAVANLTSGQTLHLAPATTFQLTDKLDINQSCTIDGHGATIKFSTSATLAQDLLFDIGSGVTITLKNINLEGKGNSVTTPSEALQFYNGNVTLEGCEIHNFYPTSSGAGAISGGGTGDLLKVKDCYIHDNGLRGIYNSSAGFTDLKLLTPLLPITASLLFGFNMEGQAVLAHITLVIVLF